jgi:hypothetical protein
LAAVLGVGTLLGIAPASAAQAKDNIKNAGKSAKEAAKSVGKAGKDVGVATAEGAKQGAKAFKNSLTGQPKQSHTRKVSSHAPRKAKTKSAKTKSAKTKSAKKTTSAHKRH